MTSSALRASALQLAGRAIFSVASMGATALVLVPLLLPYMLRISRRMSPTTIAAFKAARPSEQGASKS